ncbi:MAG: hypothetical protein ACR2KP_09855, partial [Egibacteraceae bacterium]
MLVTMRVGCSTAATRRCRARELWVDRGRDPAFTRGTHGPNRPETDGSYHDRLMERETITHCPYCSLNCGLKLVSQGQTVTGSRTWKQSPFS